MALNACGSESTKGTTLLVENDASVYLTIGAVVTMPEPDFVAETAECEDFDGADGWKEKYKTGIFDGQTMSIVLNWVSGDTTQQMLDSDFFTRLLARKFRVQYPDAALHKLDFSALSTTWGMPTPAGGGKFTRTLTLTVTGQPTFGT